ncbi:MAG: hypothetical protein J3K34DRAFT_438005 [Monoraphidium minutum]|nr:MAG: hypothetical protein J3K34DRAFT_438005 [Monoraphidium minutum]
MRSSIILLAVALLGVASAAPMCNPKCSINGVCTQSEGNIQFCKCNPGYWGETCTAMYKECKKGLVCYNGGMCVPDSSKPDQEQCACQKGWTGATCKVPHTTCGNSTLTCMNGGECILDDTINQWFCQCPPNLRGRQCQLGVTECQQGMFCMNNGACALDGVSCACPAGFFGIHCQNEERDAFADMIPRKKLPPYAVALIVIASLVAVAAIGLIAFLVVRERRGRPYFKGWQESAGTGLQGTL